ncbi:hypothetical protein DBB42_02405 [Pseudomonas plecoglossicida]|uniref:Uncharacterized protein n=1 Tax=Pseudomonas plecoglossicida TaxID=70775 RepID=A0A2R7UPF7_PSEDL|nr:hypothetical protein DBB42_02405 [Pseudomonas plecoglossicida]RFP98718.1 hypothetical protein D0O09_26635 [Pseudomonas putida]
MPAKQATRWMARASPVFAGMPAPTGIAKLADFAHESCCCLNTHNSTTDRYQGWRRFHQQCPRRIYCAPMLVGEPRGHRNTLDP